MTIIAQLQGGLGNQLFQYATARALAIQHQKKLFLDSAWFASSYEDVTSREVLIKLLKTCGELISINPSIRRPSKLRRIVQEYLPISPLIYLEKAGYRFDSGLTTLNLRHKQNLYLMGYWQSFHYFDSIREELMNEIQPINGISDDYRAYQDKIQSTSSTMVHIRRGDYVHLNSAAKVHGFLGLDYYRRGMNLMLDKNKDTHFFIFSDDLDWAKENLPYTEKMTLVYSSDSSDNVIQELSLMTQCQNYLIANSSLSWWGAWLSKHSDAHIICPQHWTNDLNMNWDDLIPGHWQRI
jgi:hypothetical protein